MKLEEQQMNIPAMAVSELVSRLTALYTGAVTAGIPLRALPTPFLWGAAGIGKSDGVRELAAELEKKTGKRVVVTDIRLLLFSPVDLRGVPMADEHREFTNWLRPRIFDMDAGDDVLNLLFLDELSAAPQSVQAAAYQITLDRRVGEHALPDNCIVIAAGNRTTDKSVAYKMPKALANRLMHYDVRSDFPSWKAWAIRSGIDARIIGYLSFDNSRLCMEPQSSDLAYPTPRSWSFASAILKASGDALASARSMIAACIGLDTAAEFEAWCRVFRELPSTDDILRGVCCDYPSRQDVLFALSASLVEAVRTRGDRITLEALENVCAYASRFPTDFAAALFRDLKELESARLPLMRCPSMQAWAKKNKSYH